MGPELHDLCYDDPCDEFVDPPTLMDLGIDEEYEYECYLADMESTDA